MHTFYGPRSIHPSTSYDDLRATPPDLSTTPYEENQSLYWHPSIYRVVNGEYILVRNLDSSPYYRWDLSVDPVAEPFPPGFRMIAASDDPVSIKTCSFLHKSRIISHLCVMVLMFALGSRWMRPRRELRQRLSSRHVHRVLHATQRL